MDGLTGNSLVLILLLFDHILKLVQVELGGHWLGDLGLDPIVKLLLKVLRFHEVGVGFIRG